MIGWLLACSPGPLDADAQVQRQLQFLVRPGESVRGADPAWLEGLETSQDPDADWWVREGETVPWTEALAPWTSEDPLFERYVPVARVGGREIWRARGPAPREAGLSELPASAAALDDPVFVGWRAIGLEAAWTAELYVRAPERAPLDLCVGVTLDGVPAAGGALVEGRQAAWPGLAERPLLRHRLRLPLEGSTPAEATLSLTDCSTGEEVHPGPTLSLTPTRRPRLTELRERPGEVADWDPEHRAHQRPAFRQTPEGLVPMEAPPLPRLRVGEAWAVMVGGETDLAASHDPETFAGLRSLMGATQAGLLTLSSPTTRQGELVFGTGPELPRRALPEALDRLDGLGLDGLIAGEGLARVTAPGQQDTLAQVAARGLAVASEQAPVLALDPAARVAEGSGVSTGPQVAVLRVVDPTDPALAEQVRAARRWAHVVVAAVDTDAPLADFVRALAAADLDGAWVLRDALGPIVVHGPLAVLDGLPPLLAEADGPVRETALLRLVVDTAGLRRMDVLPVVQQRGRLDWQEEGAVERLEAMAAASLRTGTDVRVGKALATSEVRDHFARPARSAPQDGPPPPSSAPPPASEGVPAQCTGADPGAVLMRLDGLDLLSATPLDPARPGSWVRFELRWRARRALEVGQVQWALEVPGQVVRASSTPCEGAWGFERFVPGQVVRDIVSLWLPPELPPGTAPLTATVRVGGDVLLTQREQRRFSVLQVAVEEP